MVVMTLLKVTVIIELLIKRCKMKLKKDFYRNSQSMLGGKMISKRTVQLLENVKSKVIISIGNDIYNDFLYTNLSKCSHDAEKVFQIICEQNSLKGNKEKSILINNSSEEIVSYNRVIDRIKEVSRMVSDAEQLIVYFSGHGERLENDFAMVLFDSDSKTKSNYLTLSVLSELLSECQAVEKLFLFDACFSGISIEGEKRITQKIEKEWLSNAKGFSVITACTEKQTASEKSPSDLSMFTHFLCEALNGDVEAQKDYLLTVLSLYEYIADKMGEFSLGCGISNYQKPTIKHLAEGRLVLGDYRARKFDEWIQGNCAEVKIESIASNLHLFPNEIDVYIDKRVWTIVNNLLYEIISNAFEHGNASLCKLVINSDSLEIWDNGIEFNQSKILNREGNGGGRTFYMFQKLQEELMVFLTYKVVENNNVYRFTFPIGVAFDMKRAMTINIDISSYILERKINLGNVVYKYYYLDIDEKVLPLSFSKRFVTDIINSLPEESKLILVNYKDYIYYDVDEERVILID